MKKLLVIPLLFLLSASTSPPDLASVLETEFGGCANDKALIDGAWTFQRNPKMHAIKTPSARSKRIAKEYTAHQDTGYHYVFSGDDLKQDRVKDLIKDTQAVPVVFYRCRGSGYIVFYKKS